MWLVVGICLGSGCRVLKPSPIIARQNNISSDLIAADEHQFERGQERPIIDAFGWVWGIPSKILLWDRRVENHRISPATEAIMAEYAQANGLEGVKVRLNQYRPFQDWKRLTRNQGVAWPWRYTFGVVSVFTETIIPGRLFGGDHYNPYTATVHLYSDAPAIGLHELAHAKDFSNRDYPGTYAAVYMLPIVPLWHERVATNDVLAFTQMHPNPDLHREAYRILYPAYGTYAGNAAGYAVPGYSLPLYVGGVLAGHGIGRYEMGQISDTPSAGTR